MGIGLWNKLKIYILFQKWKSGEFSIFVASAFAWVACQVPFFYHSIDQLLSDQSHLNMGQRTDRLWWYLERLTVQGRGINLVHSHRQTLSYVKSQKWLRVIGIRLYLPVWWWTKMLFSFWSKRKIKWHVEVQTIFIGYRKIKLFSRFLSFDRFEQLHSC